MRPAHTIPNVGTLREFTMWKAIVLTIVTFTIYYFVLVFQNSKDLNAVSKPGSNTWLWLFWLGFLTFGITWIILFVFNGQAYSELRRRAGLPDSSLWIVALVLSLVLSPVGDIIWAIHFNDGIRAAASGAGGTTPQAPMAHAV